MNKKEVYRIAILNHHASAPDVGGGGRHYDIAKLFAEKAIKHIIASL